MHLKIINLRPMKYWNNLMERINRQTNENWFQLISEGILITVHCLTLWYTH